MLPDFNIFHCCRQKLSAHKHIIEFPTLPIVCCCATLKNATTYISSQKISNKSAIHADNAVISLLLQSRKFWWYLLLTFFMLLHVIMTSYCCQRYAECLVTTLFEQECHTVAPRNARFLAPNLCPPNSPDLSPVDYEIWAVVQHYVYHRQIHSVDELKRRLIDVLNSRFWR